jgi:hypothetical protein
MRPIPKEGNLDGGPAWIIFSERFFPLQFFGDGKMKKFFYKYVDRMDRRKSPDLGAPKTCRMEIGSDNMNGNHSNPLGGYRYRRGY